MNTRTLINDNPIMAWKGRTFAQVTSIIKQNKLSSMTSSNSRGLIFNPLPLKLYRREIATNTSTSTTSNRRSSVRIDEFNRPGGSLVYNSSSAALPVGCVGIKNTLDINVPNDNSVLPGSLSSCNTTKNTLGPHAFSQSQNALRRVRSGGMVVSKFNAVSNKPVYYTDSKQYLTSRTKTFEQNKYNFFDTGNVAAEPGSAAAITNTYYANGTVVDCAKKAPVYYKPNNSKFAQDGGVSASSLLARLKYDTIQDVASKSTSVTSLGSAVANAMSYGVSTDLYTQKDKIGYPNACTPVINKYSGVVMLKNC